MEKQNFMFWIGIFSIIMIIFINISTNILIEYTSERFNFINEKLNVINKKLDLINQNIDDKTIILKQNDTIKNESIIVITDEYNITKYYYYKIK